MTSYYDIQNCYKFILGRPMNEEEQRAIGRNLLQISDLPLEEHRKRFLSSPEFHHRHGELLFNNYVPKPIVVPFETQDRFKIYLDLRQYHISFGIMSGEYEKADISLIKAIVPDDGHFIDVGGNVGYYSLSVASQPSFRGKVLAFEPLPRLVELFNRSIVENGLADKVSVRVLALADAPREMSLNNAEETINAGATRLVADVGDGKSGRTTQVETLDHVNGDMRPDALKVDVSGAEGLFLAGARQTIAKHKPTLLMEINRDMLMLLSKTTPGALHQQLSELGYTVWGLLHGNLTQVTTADELDLNFSRGKVANILAVHGDRMGQVDQRIRPLGIKIAKPKTRRSRVKELAL